jgi:hypothetical protein
MRDVKVRVPLGRKYAGRESRLKGRNEGGDEELWWMRVHG